MKREHVDKPVPACSVDCSEALVMLSQHEHVVYSTASNNGNCWVHTSAALMGLAISLSATGILLPQQGNKAIAATTIASQPTFTIPPNALKVAAENYPQPILQPKVIVQPNVSVGKAQRAKISPAQPKNKHQLQKKEKLQERVENTFQVEAEAITTSGNPIKSSSTFLRVQSLPIPPQAKKTQPDVTADFPFSPAVEQQTSTIVIRKTVTDAPRLSGSSASDALDVDQTKLVTTPVLAPKVLASPPPKPLKISTQNRPGAISPPAPKIATDPVTQEKAATLATPKLITKIPPLTSADQIQPQQKNQDTPVGFASPAKPVYQVQPGDTVEGIARRYGVSRSELIQANKLSNPDLILVDQQLIVPNLDAVGGSEEQFQPQWLVSQPRTENSTISSNQQLSEPLLIAQRSPQQMSREGAAGSQFPDSQTPNLNVEAPEESRSDFSVETLKADVQRLRQEYQADKEEEQESTFRNRTVTSPSQSVSPVWTEARQPEPTPQGYRLNERGDEVSSEVNTSSQPQSPIVAATPVEVESYNPMFQTPVGETVEPDLPPLSTPEQYLPDSPAQFNGYIWPAKGVITSGYGRRWGRMHKGIDIAAPIGTPIVAAAPGEVVSAGWSSGGYGNLVKVKHDDGSLTLYAHNSRILVRQGQKVDQGQQIAEMGSTGYSTGPHLHFELHPKGSGAANPTAYLPQKRS